MSKLYASWRDFPLADWHWPNFSPELACRGTGQLMIDEPSMDKLLALRASLGKPIILNSAYRSPAHNKAVGGAPGSQHLKAKAYDCRMDNQDPVAFERAARAAGFTGFGYYPKQGFMHIDTGPARVWGTPFPKSRDAATPQFQPEPKRETVVDVVTKPGVLVGAGGVISAASGVSQGSGPVQFAIGVAIVIAVCAFGAWLAMTMISRPADV